MHELPRKQTLTIEIDTVQLFDALAKIPTAEMSDKFRVVGQRISLALLDPSEWANLIALDAIYGVRITKVNAEWPDQLHSSHKTRVSDASTFDEICVKCGHTDQTGGGWGKLREPCPNADSEYEPWGRPASRPPGWHDQGGPANPGPQGDQGEPRRDVEAYERDIDNHS